MIPLGDFYRVIITVYPLQLYRNRSCLLKYINYGSPLGHFLRHLLEYFLRHPLEYLLGYFLGYPLRYFLRYFIKA